MLWFVLADAVVIVHAAYVVFVVIGFVAIVAGAIAGARWSRSFALRAAHLAAILLVCVEVAIGVVCPLTRLENSLRLRAGATSYPADFVGYWVDRLIFYNAPTWLFGLLYFGFAALVALSWWLWPPRWPHAQH
ncbi:MAG TPA: DUF2784 domain-containing protein [Candidatus Binatus sp.]|nr:DUF2784 domain-containing protein [Candidatus Binatus sp.]